MMLQEEPIDYGLSTNQPKNIPPNRKHHRGNEFGRKSAYSQAVEQQDILMRDIRDPKTKPSVRAGLSRAWDVLEERKRILRGKPLPGQLRPDLDPVQLAKAIKRSRDRSWVNSPKPVAMIGPIEAIDVTSDKVSSGAKEQPATSGEEVTSQQGTTHKASPGTKANKESLSDQGRPHTTRPGEAVDEGGG